MLLGLAAGHKKKAIGAVVAGALLASVTLLQAGDMLKSLWEKRNSAPVVTELWNDDVEDVPTLPMEEVTVVAESPPVVEDCPDGTLTVSKPDGEVLGCLGTNK